MLHEIQPLGAVGNKPILSVVIGAIVLVVLIILKQTFSLTEIQTVHKEVPMAKKILKKLRVFALDLFQTIGSNVAVGWILPAKFYGSK